MQDTVVIPSRFRGPPQSGNGGYVSGVFAELLPKHPGQAPEITLRSPIPLDTTMTVKRVSSETPEIDIFNHETLIAECRLIDSPFFDFIVPPCPDPVQIEAAMPSSLAFTQTSTHYCLTKRDSTRSVFVAGSKPKTGCTSTPHPLTKVMSPRFGKPKRHGPSTAKYLRHSYGQLWIALPNLRYECIHPNGVDGQDVCGGSRLTTAGATLIVSAWTIAVQGKKHFAGAALFDETGDLIARATTLWIGGEPI